MTLKLFYVTMTTDWEYESIQASIRMKNDLFTKKGGDQSNAADELEDQEYEPLLSSIEC